ncbi:glycosyltransferase family 2 protein [Deinococcus sonorensis]|uniref:Glycosyltransferase family 2 protein n=2 Tax=Deinococcus sonorensis TaxID=309891 RepID=A0AAU7UEK2_9DEIO
MTYEVQIVLATYNGGHYLAEQLDSILAQSHTGWQLLAHDDGSSDDTLAILRAYQSRLGHQLQVVEHPSCGGASANFSFLLNRTNAPYVFLADQDDIWQPDKLERFMRAIRRAEVLAGIQTPLLVHSDLELVDDAGQPVAPSFWQYQHLDPRWGDHVPRLLTQNVVTGCATLVNRALLDLALPVPADAVMHDWWLALVACATGKVIWMPSTTVRYRQHSSNTLGAQKFDWHYILSKLGSLTDRQAARTTLMQNTQQARAFAERFSDNGWAAEAALFGSLSEMSRLLKARTILQHGFWKVGLLRNLAWLFL